MQRSTHKHREPKIKSTNAYSIAHTARCKLHMSAKDPDRNLRFMLGHAFLLDKALYRVAQIEEDDEPEEEEQQQQQKQLNPQVPKALHDDNEKGLGTGHVTAAESGSLSGGTVNVHSAADNSTVEIRELDSTDNDGDRTPPDDEAPDDFDFDDGLDLTRFVSASQKPPRMIPDEGEDDEEEELDEAISPPELPEDFDLGTIVAGPESEDVGELYERVRGCRCHGLGEKAEKGKKFWEVKNEVDRLGKRLAIMQVEA